MSTSVKVNYDNNFCRVFLLPDKMPDDYCFGTKHGVIFEMVDWFNPISWDDIRDSKIASWDVYKIQIEKFLKDKWYMVPRRKYLIITDFNESFVFEKE